MRCQRHKVRSGCVERLSKQELLILRFRLVSRVKYDEIVELDAVIRLQDIAIVRKHANVTCQDAQHT